MHLLLAASHAAELGSSAAAPADGGLSVCVCTCVSVCELSVWLRRSTCACSYACADACSLLLPRLSPPLF